MCISYCELCVSDGNERQNTEYKWSIHDWSNYTNSWDPEKGHKRHVFPIDDTIEAFDQPTYSHGSKHRLLLNAIRAAFSCPFDIKTDLIGMLATLSLEEGVYNLWSKLFDCRVVLRTCGDVAHDHVIPGSACCPTRLGSEGIKRRVEFVRASENMVNCRNARHCCGRIK